jgi:hypothetical protein
VKKSQLGEELVLVAVVRWCLERFLVKANVQ